MKKQQDPTPDFVFRHWQPKSLRPTRRYAPVSHHRQWIAAASFLGCAFIASAVWYLCHTVEPLEIVQPASSASQPAAVSPYFEPLSDTEFRVEYTDVDIPTVISDIEHYSGRKVQGLVPDIHVTLSYTGDVEGLIDALNDLFDTDLSFEQ